MVKGLLGVVIGLVCYIIVIQLVETLVTGTATGDTIIQNILALAVAIGVVIFASTRMFGGLWRVISTANWPNSVNPKSAFRSSTHGNTELNRVFVTLKCVETRWSASLAGMMV